MPSRGTFATPRSWKLSKEARRSRRSQFRASPSRSSKDGLRRKNVPQLPLRSDNARDGRWFVTGYEAELAKAAEESRHKSVKCVVWDLDNTIWQGVLLEDRNVTLRPEAVKILQQLDSRGILHSIASRNDHE